LGRSTASERIGQVNLQPRLCPWLFSLCKGHGRGGAIQQAKREQLHHMQVSFFFPLFFSQSSHHVLYFVLYFFLSFSAYVLGFRLL
jgi:hypothetical protein